MATNQTATFAIDLKDGTSGPAEKASSALAELREALQSDTRELAAMQKAMKNLQLGSSVNVAQFRDLKSKIDAKKASIAAAQSSYLALGGSMKKVAREGRSSADRFKELAKAAGFLPGPLAGISAKLAGMGVTLKGAAIAVGVLGIVAALAALAVASVRAAADMLAYGVAQSDARRSELLRLESLVGMRGGMQGVTVAAAGLRDAIDRVTDASALSREDVTGLANDLARAGLRGAEFEAALNSAVSKKQGFGPASRQMLSLGVQLTKLKNSFGRIFDGLNIEPLLRGLRTVTGMFSQNEAVGRALRTMFSTLFQPVIDQSDDAASSVKRFVQGMVLAALDLEISYLKAKIATKGFYDSFRSESEGSQTAILAGEVALVTFAAALGGVAIVAGVVAIAFALLGLALAGVGVLFYLIYKGVTLLFDALTWLGESIGNLAFDAVALVDGLIDGITSGLPKVIAAVKGLASGAMNAFKSALGISSPSKIFARFGLQVSEGVEVGIGAGRGGVDSAVSGLVSAPGDPLIPAGGADGAAPRGGQSVTLTIGDIIIQTQATEAAGIAQEVRREMETLLEGLAIQFGAPA